ncbi:MAG TPA: hypothetical protein VFQ75_06110 [Candidatus Limnocylindrales bacterium]|jgi:hypothetical protein|nr:hypothetical protein [Candidatus Limnocylindrales bacterium]
MRPARTAIGIILALLGAVWLGQGLGLLPGGFMRGSAFWGLVGGVLVVAGILLLVVERRRTR